MSLGCSAVTGITREEVPPVVERSRRPDRVHRSRFVKLGRPLAQAALPQKEVPTAPRRRPSLATPKPLRQEDRSPRRQRGEPRTADDLIAQLGNRADDIANKAKAREMEGDINGIEEGTEKADEGDIYAGLLYNFFRHGWTVPTSIPDEELRGNSSAP
jgi:hypothetical protein